MNDYDCGVKALFQWIFFSATIGGGVIGAFVLFLFLKAIALVLFIIFFIIYMHATGVQM